MKAMHRFVVSAAVAGIALVAGTAVQAACSTVSVKGEALTKEIAQEMTKMNLEFAVMAKGAKAAGKAAVKCAAPGPLLLTSCTGKQRACS
jgi:outer membrane murein-binding lipoprotein Lpp